MKNQTPLDVADIGRRLQEPPLAGSARQGSASSRLQLLFSALASGPGGRVRLYAAVLGALWGPAFLPGCGENHEAEAPIRRTPLEEAAWQREQLLLGHVRRNPKDGVACWQLARFYRRHGNFPAARRWFAACVGDPQEKASEKGLAPDLSPALIEFGELLLDEGRPEGAEKVFARALRLTPEDPRAHYGLGRCAQTRGDQDRARAAYEQALKVAPGFAAARLALGQLEYDGGYYRSAEAQLRGVLESRPPPATLVVAGYNLALVYLAQEQLPAAWECAAYAASLEPANADAQYLLAYLSGRRGDTPSRERALRACLEADPTHPAAWRELARLLADSGRPQEAVEAYRQALLAAPREEMLQKEEAENAYAAWELSRRNGHRGEREHLERCAEAWGRLARNFPDKLDYAYQWGRVLESLQRPNAAFKCYLDRVLKKDGNHLEARKRVAWLYAHVKDKPLEAIGHYEKVIAQYPDDGQAHLELGRLYCRLAQQRLRRMPLVADFLAPLWSLTVETLEAGQELALPEIFAAFRPPQNKREEQEQAQNHLLWTQYVNLAQQHLQRAVELRKDDAQAHLWYAWLQFARNKHELAEAELEKARALQANPAELRLNAALIAAACGRYPQAAEALQELLQSPLPLPAEMRNGARLLLAVVWHCDRQEKRSLAAFRELLAQMEMKPGHQAQRLFLAALVHLVRAQRLTEPGDARRERQMAVRCLHDAVARRELQAQWLVVAEQLLGRVHFELGAFTLSVYHYQRAVKMLGPQAGKTRERLALAALEAGATPLAREQYLVLGETYERKGFLEAARLEGDPRRRVLLLDKYLKLSPKDKRARQMLAETYLEDGETAAVREELKRLQHDFGDDPEVWLFSGKTHQAAGDSESAARDFQVYLKLGGDPQQLPEGTTIPREKP